MNDLIDRRKAFEYFVTLWECIGTIMDRNEWEDVCMTTANEIPSVQPEQWIPCSERPPEEGHDVLITKESFQIKGYEQEVIKAKRSVDPRSGKIEWWSPEFGALKDKAVLAWMPLPKPYKEEQND